MEEGVSGIGDIKQETESSIKENDISKKILTQNIQ